VLGKSRHHSPQFFVSHITLKLSNIGRSLLIEPSAGVHVIVRSKFITDYMAPQFQLATSDKFSYSGDCLIKLLISDVVLPADVVNSPKDVPLRDFTFLSVKVQVQHPYNSTDSTVALNSLNFSRLSSVCVGYTKQGLSWSRCRVVVLPSCPST